MTAAATSSTATSTATMPPEVPPPGPERPRIERGVPTRMRKQGLFKPQHRVVLFLLAASAGSFLLTILFPPPDPALEPSSAAAVAAASGPLVFPRERGAFVSLDPGEGEGSAAPIEGGDLVAAAQALAPKLSACAAAHARALAPLDGRVVVRAEVGPEGLQRAGLVDVAEIDPSARACLATAAWQHAWPRREPAEGVAVPFYVVAPLERTSGEGPPPDAASP